MEIFSDEFTQLAPFSLSLHN